MASVGSLLKTVNGALFLLIQYAAEPTNAWIGRFANKSTIMELKTFGLPERWPLV